MALVKGAFSKLLKPMTKGSSGFLVTKELVNDDLYGNILHSPYKHMKKKRITKLIIKTQHTIDLGGGEVSLDGNEFYVASMRTKNAEDIRKLVTALQMILKVSKNAK